MSLQRLRAPLIVSIVLMLSVQRASMADLFDQIYAKGQPLEASLKTLTARFVEESSSSLLTRPLVARGRLAVVRPDRIVLHYLEPERRTVLIDGKSMRLVWPSRAIDQHVPIGAQQRRIQQYFVDKSPAQLRSHFEITATEPAEATTWLVTMVPRRRQIREGLARLELSIARDTVMLTSLQMTFPNGDTKRLSFEDVQLNPAIDESAFRPLPP